MTLSGVIEYQDFFVGIIQKVFDNEIDPAAKQKGKAPPAISG